MNDKDDKDDDDEDNRCNHDDVDHYDDNGDLGQVVILSDPFNCNTLAVKAAHHPHCPTEKNLSKKDAKDNVNDNDNRARDDLVESPIIMM